MTRSKKWIAVVMGLVFLSACSYDASQKGAYMKNYEEVIKKTEAQRMPLLKSGTVEEKQALDRFRNFYRVFSAQNISIAIKDLYRSDAYFRDGFREVSGVDAIKSYFLSSTEAFVECRFDIQDVADHEGNYYFRWVMTLVLKRKKDEPLQAVGMSHVRFDEKGMIVFHQDYWDTGIIYEQAPVLGRMITWIRSRV